MDDLQFKGENAEITSEHSSLDTVFISEKEEMKNIERENSLEDQKINGDSSLSIRGNNSPSKKKLRKSKAVSVVSGDSNRLCFVSSLDNRTLPESTIEMYSSESEEFSGFDLKELHVSEPGRTILKKLLAEAESISELAFKRQKIVLPLLKNVKNADNLIEEADENSTDSEDQKLVSAAALCTNTDESKSLSEKLASNNMHINATRSRRSRYSRGASPGNTIRQKVSVDITNPAYKEPFNYGWKRELVYRAGASENQSRRMADIYYYTPEGKKVRSYREVIEFLTTCDLTIDNFTFFKEPLGINDPEKEIIRDAKKSKDIYHNKSSIKVSKKIAEVITTKKNSPKRMDKSPPLVATYKTSPRSIKSSATFKVKLPVKKSTYKRGIKSPSAVLEKETSISPQWTLPVTRRNQNVSEKSLPTKTKKMIRA